jgi:hypothetical protein
LVLVNPSRLGIALQSASWRLQRRDQPVLAADGLSIQLPHVELTRGTDDLLDYTPKLSAQAITTLSDSPPLNLYRVLDLKRPQVFISAINFITPPERGKLEPHTGTSKKIVWDVQYRVDASYLVNPARLSYRWTITSDPPSAANPPVLITTSIPEMQYSLEYALPHKNTYVYKLAVTVTNEHDLEQARAEWEIRLPQPTALIVGHIEVLQQGRTGPLNPHRFTGSVATGFLRGALRYHWSVQDWEVRQQSPADRDTFSFEYDFSPIMPSLDPFAAAIRGPLVKVTVTDEAGQIAEDAYQLGQLDGGWRRMGEWLRDLARLARIGDRDWLEPRPRQPDLSSILDQAVDTMRSRLARDLSGRRPESLEAHGATNAREITDVDVRVRAAHLTRSKWPLLTQSHETRSAEEVGPLAREVSRVIEEAGLAWRGRVGAGRRGGDRRKAAVIGLMDAINRLGAGER